MDMHGYRLKGKHIYAPTEYRWRLRLKRFALFYLFFVGVVNIHFLACKHVFKKVFLKVMLVCGAGV